MCKTENRHITSELFLKSDRRCQVVIHPRLSNLRLFIIVGLAILLYSSSLVQSQILRGSNYGKTDEYFNPGIKIGYTFGQNGGMTYGIEVSYTKVYDESVAEGFVFDLDYTPAMKTWKALVGYEIGGAMGLCAGPTILLAPIGIDLGMSAIPFTLVPLSPIIPYFYYQYILRFSSEPDIHEIGGYAKVPLQTDRRKYY